MTKTQMLRKKDILSIVLLMLAGPIFAQNNVNGGDFKKMVDFLPPAPNASAIIKHSTIGVGNTGAPNISVPLFSIKGNKLSAGVSIAYGSTGIKVDEIASRVGMGWSLQAGGVLTRTVRGWPDENCSRLAPPAAIGYNCGTYNFCNSITSSGNSGPYDSEPDLYNFSMNGISGSFVFDANMNPVIIPAQKYKIEKNFTGTVWNFKITATDGIMYYFGGTGAVEKTKRLSGCGDKFTIFTPTAWYLTKIEHPTGETITFVYTPLEYDYDTGVNETQYWAWWQIDYNIVPSGASISCPSGECPPAPGSSRCVTKTKTQGVLLTGINNGYCTISFSYDSRLDCTDKLLSYVSLNNGSVYAGRFNFLYTEQQANPAYQNETLPGNANNYTPYLTDLEQVSPDNLITLTHRFVYDDPGNRPPRLSFSQDHWGYFNGKINTTFVPKQTDPQWISKFPNALANREVDPAFAGKGLLTKVVYPTGGVDIIDYESNEWFHQEEFSTPHAYNCFVIGAGSGNTSTVVSKSTDFTIDRGQAVSLTFSCIKTGNGTVYEHWNYSEVQVLNLGTNTQVYAHGLHTGETETVLLANGYLPAGTYRLTYKARGAVITTSVALKYKAKAFPAASSNTIVGGLRVKRILTGNPSETPMIKRYYYGEPETLNQSTLYHSGMPVYLKAYANTLECTITLPGNNLPGAHAALCHMEALYSNSLRNIFDYQGAPVSYNSVIESEGENFEGGAKQTKFYFGSDVPATAVLGQLMLGAPLSNFSQMGNGRVLEENIFKKSSGNSLILVKKTHNNLINDTRAGSELFGYAVNKKRQIVGWVPGNTCPPSTPVAESVMSCFDINRYHISAPWLHLESQTETVYDENGANPITSTRNFYYDNLAHLQLSRTETLNSKNQLIKQTNTYPSDHASTAPYNSMIAKNILEPVITNTSSIVGTPDIPLQQVAVDYGNVGGALSTFYAPVAVKKSAKGNPLEIEGTIDQYDVFGNILQFTGKDGTVTSIIWGYNFLYPVAQVVGAGYSAVVAALGSNYPSLQSMDGATLLTALHTIRTGIPAARVTTYTYKPGIGVASITDPNNKINHYEYDALGRLSVIKDQDGNAVKKNEYNIVNSSSSSTLNVFFNEQQTKYITCNNCEANYSGTVVAYVIPFGKYFSLISQVDADAQANADTGGQEYANKFGTCANVGCYGN